MAPPPRGTRTGPRPCTATDPRSGRGDTPEVSKEDEARSDSCLWQPRRPLPEAEERTEGAGGLAAFFLGDLQRRGNVKVTGERRAHRGYRGTAVAGGVALRAAGRRVQALQPGARRVQAGPAEVPVLVPAAVQDQQPDGGRGVLLEQVA